LPSFFEQKAAFADTTHRPLGEVNGHEVHVGILTCRASARPRTRASPVRSPQLFLYLPASSLESPFLISNRNHRIPTPPTTTNQKHPSGRVAFVRGHLLPVSRVVVTLHLCFFSSRSPSLIVFSLSVSAGSLCYCCLCSSIPS
jgi:hypothetical protein